MLFDSPPGTGKTYIGVELIRVLLTNRVGPLLMIAFTNHALDHMLSSVLDADITQKIVRLGSRSGDERISNFNIEILETVQGQSRLDQTLRAQFGELKETQKEMEALMSLIRTSTVTEQEMDVFLQVQYPDGYVSLQTPPSWVNALIKDQYSGWRTAGIVSSDSSIYGFWERSSDLRYSKSWKPKTPSLGQDGAISNRFEVLDVDPQEPSGDEAESETSKLDSPSIIPDMGLASTWMQHWPDPNEDFTAVPNHDAKTSEGSPQLSTADSSDPTVLQDALFAYFNLDGRPEIPTTDRLIPDLLIPGVDMWSLSEKERTRLSRYWKDAASRSHAQEQIDQFSRLRQKFENARVRYNEIKDQVRPYLLWENLEGS